MEPLDRRAVQSPPDRPPMRLALFLLLAATASAQAGRDVVVDGRSIVGRWTAVEVLGDWDATVDVRRGALTTVLTVAPTGQVWLHGTDWERAPGQTQVFEGRIRGDRLRLDGRPGEAELQLLGPRLHLVDPTGRETVFERPR